MRNFFHIKGEYKFEYNDIRAIVTVINVVLIICYGLSVAWFGLTIGIVGIIKDLKVDRRINNLTMHIANTILYTFLLLTFN